MFHLLKVILGQSSWKLIYENKEFKLKNIDVYIDTYFIIKIYTTTII